jgi:hypothetical protein
MKPQDLDRIRYVTRHLGDLQSSVKLGSLMGLCMLSGGLVSYTKSFLWFLPQLASIAGVFFVATHPQGPLEARFGKVEKKRKWKWTASDRAQGWVFLGGLLLLILLSGCLWFVFSVLHSARAVDLFSERLTYLLFGVGFLLRWPFREYRLVESYNLGIAALFLAIGTRGALPGLTPPAWLITRSGMSWILYGSALILTGLVDYWQLARTLPPLAEESEALEPEETR